MKFFKAALIFTLALSAYAQSANQEDTSAPSKVPDSQEASVVPAATEAPASSTPSSSPETPETQDTPVGQDAPASPPAQDAPATPAAQDGQAAPAAQDVPSDIASQSIGKAEVIYHCTVPNTIAFTIDDGPTEHTEKLLAALKDAGITATFYINGANVLKDEKGEALPSVEGYIKQIYEAGHEIGSHTYNHACRTAQCKTNNPLMKVMDTRDKFAEQISKNEDLIYKAIGKYPATYRAPFGDGQNPGAVDEQLLQWLYEFGYPYAIHWDIETRDMENVASGGDDFAFLEAKKSYEGELAQSDKLITLQHAIPVTIEKIIPYLKNEWKPKHPDMKFVTVSECLGIPKDSVYKSKPGQVVPGNVESSDAKMVKASYALFVSAILAILYLF